MRHPKNPCPDCGGPKLPTSLRCSACRFKVKAELAAQKLICPECGGKRSKPYVPRCMACRRAAESSVTYCPDCGKQKSDYRVERCAACFAAILEGKHANVAGILLTFSAGAFRALLDRSEVEWTVRQLANRSGVGRRTIHDWLSGRCKPRQVEWQRVAEVLALEPCQHCHGQGTVDPTQQRISEITASVQRRLRVLPAAQPVIHGAGWTLDPNALSLTIGAVTVRLTRQEAALVSTVAQAERFVPTTALEPAARTHLSRLRAKCAAAGADLGNVIETVIGAGYRARLARDVEATG